MVLAWDQRPVVTYAPLRSAHMYVFRAFESNKTSVWRRPEIVGSPAACRSGSGSGWSRSRFQSYLLSRLILRR